MKCIYAFRHLEGANDDGFAVLEAVRSAVMDVAPAILQADLEGVSNTQGYHIFWQFSDDVKGPGWMGLFLDGKWIHFEMELGDPKQREAFFAGRIPDGVRLAPAAEAEPA